MDKQQHRWPRSGGWRSSSSIGSVECQQCNVCLAMRLTFTTYDLEGNPIIAESIVEPTNNQGYPEALCTIKE